MRDVRTMSSQAAKLFSRVGDYENRRSCREWVARSGCRPIILPEMSMPRANLFFAGLRMLEPPCARSNVSEFHAWELPNLFHGLANMRTEIGVRRSQIPRARGVPDLFCGSTNVRTGFRALPTARGR